MGIEKMGNEHMWEKHYDAHYLSHTQFFAKTIVIIHYDKDSTSLFAVFVIKTHVARALGPIKITVASH